MKELSVEEGSFFIMRYAFILLFTGVCVASSACAQLPRYVEERYKKIIVTLSADSMRGRMAGTSGEVRAGNFVAREFSALHLTAATQAFSYRIDDTGIIHNSRNIYCYINNHADSTILIGAHYDHLGMGGGRSRSYGKTGIHPGADDNASGVALMMGLAYRYGEWARKKYNYLFVSYGAHEVGLYGSAAFGKYCAKHFKAICLAVNFDMVGRLDSQEKVISMYGGQTLHKAGLGQLTAVFSGRVDTGEPDKIYQTDCKALADRNVACLSFTTGIHDDYHKITDVAGKINYNGIWAIQQLVEHILQNYP
jgi:hypothetical protein